MVEPRPWDQGKRRNPKNHTRTCATPPAMALVGRPRGWKRFEPTSPGFRNLMETGSAHPASWTRVNRPPPEQVVKPGQKMFARCWICRAVAAGARARSGPSARALRAQGRQCRRLRLFTSDEGLRVIWNEETLAKYICDLKAFSRQPYGLSGHQKRQRVRRSAPILNRRQNNALAPSAVRFTKGRDCDPWRVSRRSISHFEIGR